MRAAAHDVGAAHHHEVSGIAGGLADGLGHREFADAGAAGAEAVAHGDGVVISLTDCYRETDYGEPIVALKSYLLSPFAEEQYVEAVLQSLWKARAKIAAEPANSKVGSA